MTGLMMKDALVMRKTLRLYALFLLFYSGLAVLGVFPHVHGPGYGGGDRDGAAHLQLQL